MAGNVVEYISPSRAGLINDGTVFTLSPECVGPEALALGGATISVDWTANLLAFFPLIIAAPLKVAQFFWFNGTNAAGDTDIGIYSGDGLTKLVSTGPTANSGGNSMQVVDIADYVLPANSRLWLAIGTDSSSQDYLRLTWNAAVSNLLGLKSQTSGWSSGLPSTISFADAGASLLWCGFTGSSVI